MVGVYVNVIGASTRGISLFSNNEILCDTIISYLICRNTYAGSKMGTFNEDQYERIIDIRDILYETEGSAEKKGDGEDWWKVGRKFLVKFTTGRLREERKRFDLVMNRVTNSSHLHTTCIIFVCTYGDDNDNLRN